MAVDNHSLCILGAMDRLWFHQFILFPVPSSPLVTKTLPQSHSFASGVSSSFNTNEDIPSSVSASASSFSEEDSSSFPSTATPHSSMVDSNNEEEDEKEDKEVENKEKPGRLNLVADKTRSHSSSSSTEKPRKSRRHSRKLQKSMSCRSLSELELEEVKGFLDLGFKFKKEHLNPRMMSIVPGLQRLGLLGERHSSTISELNGIAESVAKNEKFEEEEERGVMRPYLSEAWLIKRPNSPLLNLKVPRGYAAADMKRHLRFWAKMVASEIQHEPETS